MDREDVEKLSSYFDALTDRHRRYALYYLSNRGTAHIEELARHITAMERGRSPRVLAEEGYKPIQQELRHNHLPRLADLGVIEFDSRSGDVRFMEPSRTFMVLLWFSELLEGQR